MMSTNKSKLTQTVLFFGILFIGIIALTSMQSEATTLNTSSNSMKNDYLSTETPTAKFIITDSKCGGDKKEAKKSESKCGGDAKEAKKEANNADDAKTKDTNDTEAKCGSDAKEAKKETKKIEESKCGAGKCGAA